MITFLGVSFIITIVTLAIAFLGFSLAMLKSTMRGESKGLKDFKLQMSIVALVWLIGEASSIFLSNAISDNVHFLSVILFSTFLVIRSGVLLDRFSKSSDPAKEKIPQTH